jgi:hypothetical protein
MLTPTSGHALPKIVACPAYAAAGASRLVLLHVVGMPEFRPVSDGLYGFVPDRAIGWIMAGSVHRPQANRVFSVIFL